MAKTNKTTPKAGETESPEATSPNTGLQSLKEESGDQKEETGPEPDPNTTEKDEPKEVVTTHELIVERHPRQMVEYCTDTLSEIVKNHHEISALSKKSDYNQLMRKIENLKADILKFIN